MPAKTHWFHLLITLTQFNQGNDQTDNAATGEFTLTVPLNSNVELTVMKAGFYDNVQSDLIDEDKNWLIVMIPSVKLLNT